jgi:nucleotide-binding universal stress UspA family protein
MVPLSGRIEDDLYQWFISLDYVGAKSNSDKLREALKELRLQHEATSDAVKAQAWLQTKMNSLRKALIVIDHDEAVHSEVFAVLMDHIVSMSATLMSAKPANLKEAAQIEDQLVRRALALNEALLRQALTPGAAAFDPDVIARHIKRSVELANLIHPTTKGDSND